MTLKEVDAARGTSHKDTLLIDRVEYPKYILSLHIAWCWISANNTTLVEAHLLRKLTNPVKDSFENIIVDGISSNQSLNPFSQPYVFGKAYSLTSRNSA